MLDVCQLDRSRPLQHSSLDFAAMFLRKVISVNYIVSCSLEFGLGAHSEKGSGNAADDYTV